MSWEIRSVSDETINVIKHKAKERGLTIGQFLDWHFTGEVEYIGAKKPEFRKEYKLIISQAAMEKLKRKAISKGFNVSKYLEYLANDFS
jgi:predicted DNA binding CopG/RHH family protein